LSREEVLRVAEGRVWTGQQAKDLGLVDELGGFERALALAKETVGIAPQQTVELREFPAALTPWQEVLELLNGTPGLIHAVGAWLQLLQPGALSTPPIAIR
jgi:protease-4